MLKDRQNTKTEAAPDAPVYDAGKHLPARGRRLPVSTYRLQLGPQFTFAQAQEILPYLVDLGVTDLYLSPILQSAPGSQHGYDVVDHSRISEPMGGRDGFERFSRAAHDLGLFVIVDVVPNHMAVPTPAYLNRQLWSVLKEGTASPYVSWFDVDLDDEGGLLMPVLGDRIGAVIARGELTVDTLVVPGEEDLGEQYVLRYFDHVFPVKEGTEALPMADLVERQHYRLAYWKVADEELNYRRFFDVGTLAAVRVEKKEVFDATHALLLQLFERGLIDAFRVDHPDGLADPRGYFRDLAEATGGAWVVAEKILEGDEELPDDWPVAGTVGYDTAWRLGTYLVDSSGAIPLAGVMNELVDGPAQSFPRIVADAKRQIATTSLYAEVHRLAKRLAELCHDDIRLRDHTFRALYDCVLELLLAMDRYRIYVHPGEPASSSAERRMREVAERARTNLEPDRLETLDVVVELLLGREVGTASRITDEERAEVIVRFQQACGPVMAKGIEDTAFYRWTHLTCLNEVGSSPGNIGMARDELDTWVARTIAAWPATMTLGTTHDTKRGEDVRARIGVISEYHEQWAELVRDLREATAHLRPASLDGAMENLLWQTLVGTWTPEGPIEADRLVGYLTKAAREQKTWTTWTAPDQQREQELFDYARALLEHDAVRDRFDAWVKMSADAVRVAVLTMKTVQMTILGVADVYQGSEVTQNSLVDPDNRRDVDHAGHAQMLAELDERGKLGASSSLDREKLWVTAQILRLRRRLPDVFVGARSGYEPLATTSTHTFAFTRTLDGEARVVVLAERRHARLEALGGWRDHVVDLPAGRWRDVLTGAETDGGQVLVAEVLDALPVAVLERIDDEDSAAEEA